MVYTPIQVIAILFSLFALSRAFLRLKEGRITNKEFAFWAFIWIAIIAVSLMPQLTFVLSGAVGIERGIDLAVYTSVMLLFYLSFRVLVRMDEIEKQITQVTKHIALQGIENRKKEIKERK